MKFNFIINNYKCKHELINKNINKYKYKYDRISK